MSLAGQWDAVNGEVLRRPTVHASMEQDHQLERCSISDVKTVELLMEQLTEPLIVLTSLAGDGRAAALSTRKSLSITAF